jgi:hypothetical protein
VNFIRKVFKRVVWLKTGCIASYTLAEAYFELRLLLNSALCSHPSLDSETSTPAATGLLTCFSTPPPPPPGLSGAFAIPYLQHHYSYYLFTLSSNICRHTRSCRKLFGSVVSQQLCNNLFVRFCVWPASSGIT